MPGRALCSHLRWHSGLCPTEVRQWKKEKPSPWDLVLRDLWLQGRWPEELIHSRKSEGAAWNVHIVFCEDLQLDAFFVPFKFDKVPSRSATSILQMKKPRLSEIW